MPQGCHSVSILHRHLILWYVRDSVDACFKTDIAIQQQLLLPLISCFKEQPLRHQHFNAIHPMQTVTNV